MISYEQRTILMQLVAVYDERLRELSEREVYYEFVNNYDSFDEEYDSFRSKNDMIVLLLNSYRRKLMKTPLNKLEEMLN